MENSNKEINESLFDKTDNLILDPKNQIRSIYDRFVDGFTETYNDPETIGKQIIIYLDELEPKDAQATAKLLIKQYAHYGTSVGASTFIFNKKGVNIKEWKRAKGALDVILKDWIINHTYQPKENKSLDFPIYCKVGALFAQNRIERSKADYYFDSNNYGTLANVHRAVQKELDTKSTVRQYISDTINKDGIKNLLEISKKTKVIEYCKHNRIKITNPEFK